MIFEYALQYVSDSDMVAIYILKQVNQNDKPMWISFRRKDQFSEDVMWNVFEIGSQSNARFDAQDTQNVTVHEVKMTVSFGK